MVLDSELVERLREILSVSDLNTTTTAIVRRRLEEDFGIDLSDRKAFIREPVDVYMQSQFENAAENEDKIDGEEVEKEEEEEEDDGEEDLIVVTEGKPSTKKRKKAKVKKRGGGFTKLCCLSPELQKFTGVPKLARTEDVKQLWIHIKENNLQDPSNKWNIICDDILRSLFDVDTIDMFQMNKALTKHIWTLDSDGAPVKSVPKEKQRKKDSDEEEDQPKKKQKRQKGAPRAGNSAFLAPVKLSNALVKFLDIEGSALPRSDVVKRIWDYIKLNNLQDPSDKRQIICDEKLKELFNVETFHGFSVAKHLTAHLTKIEQ